MVCVNICIALVCIVLVWFYIQKKVKTKAKVLLFTYLLVLYISVWVGWRVPFYWMTSSDCIRGWKCCDLKHSLTNGKPLTCNLITHDKYLIIFNSGLAKNLQIACKVTDPVCVCICMPLHSFVAVYLFVTVNVLVNCVGAKAVSVSDLLFF